MPEAVAPTLDLSGDPPLVGELPDFLVGEIEVEALGWFIYWVMRPPLILLPCIS
jgi:hypothetical protein